MYLSDKYPRFPKAGGTDGLKIKLNKNKVTIYWYCYFAGDNVDEKAFDSTSTFRKVITEAIKKKWSGSSFTVKGIKKVNVKTKIEDKSDGKSHIYAKGQNWSAIRFHNKAGIPHVQWPNKNLDWHGWTRNNPGDMELYKGDSRADKGHRYSGDSFKVLVAHEFGHILGIADGYNNDSTENINSIMCDQWGSRNKIKVNKRKATGLDITKALDAYNTNQVQYWN
jgi:hypothetical protein